MSDAITHPLMAFLDARLAEELADVCSLDERALIGWFRTDSAGHIRKIDLVPLARNVKAKGVILDLHKPVPVYIGSTLVLVACEAGCRDEQRHAWPCPTVREIAAANCDHPDYVQEWGPRA